jgi:peptide chain release factor 3
VNDDPGLDHGGDHQLGDAHAAGDGEGVGAEIGEDHLDLAAIVAVDGAGRVQTGDSGFQSEAGARTDLALETLRDLHHQPGGHGEAVAGRQLDRLVLIDGGAQIHAGGPGRLIGGKLQSIAMREAKNKQRRCGIGGGLWQAVRLDHGPSFYSCRVEVNCMAGGKTVEGSAINRNPPPMEVARRRTFAIIAHPDAGKTTLTEKLLLFGGAIQLAGEVKAKKDRIHSRSDWMKIERERGISVVTSVMTFEYDGNVFNILDTPGHEDFADDTYRTLTAVDAAVMVIDAAKGIEPRTLKLFEVCRMRDIPIITFINKMDRESRDPFEILDEVEEKLALDTAPVTWPVGRSKTFCGAYNLANNTFRGSDTQVEATPVNGPQAVAEHLPENERETFIEELELAREACRPFDRESFLEGHLTPVFFGSALRNFGVRDLINALGDFAPPPRDQEADSRIVHANEDKMTAFVFKIQANMDPNHRDRIAFARICSGKLQRGMKARLSRTGKQLGLTAPQFFFASQRQIADTAFAGDVVGIPNHGTLRIGDTLTEGEPLVFHGVPNFAPEILRRVRLGDAMKAKKLKEACSRWPRKASSSSSCRKTVRRPSSAWSVRCSSTY